MREVIVLEAGGQPGANVLLQIDLDMVGFSLVNWRNILNGAVFLSSESPCGDEASLLDMPAIRITIGQPIHLKSIQEDHYV